MKKNLSEAVFNEEEMDEFRDESLNIDKSQNGLLNPNDISLGSPAAFISSNKCKIYLIQT